MVRAAAWLAAGLGVFWSNIAFAQVSGTRESGFSYDAGSGLLTQEVVEPNLSQYRLQTDYGYDAFGNKASVTVSGADIATRTAATTYDARGQFATTAANALGQSESWTYDDRFGLPLSHTGPNGLTTTWEYDGFGRKVLEVRADGTRIRWSYQYCSGTAGGTANCPAGAVYLVESKKLAADDATPIGPLTTGYFDKLGRSIIGDTQGFDGSTIRTTVQYDALGRVAQKSKPYFVDGGTPQWLTTSYDVLGRPVTETFPDGSSLSHAYHGLITIDTNALGQTKITEKNSQGKVVAVTDALNSTATFAYDPFGNLVRSVDPVGNVTTNTYDQRGRKIASDNPDMGTWSYSYNVLDQLVSQTDAKGQTTAVSYDLLGRIVERIEPDLTSNWSYDTAPAGVGKPASASTNGGYSRSYSYDALGRPTQTQFTVDGASHAIGTAYDSAGRVASVSYPSGLTVAYAYNAYGYQNQLTNASSGEVYWTADARDAELRLTQQTAGNGVATTQTFDPVMGRLTDIQSGADATVQSFGYSYDLIGNLVSRTDANTALSETFTYDSLNRLTSATVGVDTAKTYSYDSIGNLISKSDAGAYTYPAAGQAFPHAVTSVSGSVINATFTYDANGNMTSGNGLTLAYSAANKPAEITRGTTSISFGQDPDHQRYKQIAPGSTTLYLAASGVLAEKVTGGGGVVQWNNYLVTAAGMIGMRVERSDGGLYTRYFHKDHLGSIAVLTDETGAVVERLSYDAWGKRRHPNGQDDPAGSLTSQTTRGFTGHEQLDDVGLVHMNGRVYDPLIGRFGTPDPTTENPFSTQGWNRYSYVGNSPLNFTDPSGYCFMGCFWQKPFKALGRVLRGVPMLGNILTIAAAYACGPAGPICAAAASALVAGVTSGDLGQALRAGFISAATAGAFQVVGDLTSGFAGTLTPAGGHGPLEFLSDAHLFNMAGHAAVGCLSAVASGGKCGPGAASGAVSSFTGPLLRGLRFGERLVAQTAVGGLASVAGGGKFGNGAVTAAFGYLFNELASKARSRFKTQDDAARAALQEANPISIRDGREYGGVIYATESGYDYTDPISGTGHSFDPSNVTMPDGVRFAADYHTHGPYGMIRFYDGKFIRTDTPQMDNANSDNFSESDKIAAGNRGSGIPGYRAYLGTPSGVFRVYIPSTKQDLVFR